jgi:ADP-ribose pyrophosphatase YjhB (NUDIX family)
MRNLLENPDFSADYQKLRAVKLNPARHAAATAYEHCEMVAARAVHLAGLNACTPEETQVLKNLAHAHDIGKIGGTANPEESVELLPRYGPIDPGFVALVKYHDTNLPWYLASEKGQAPSDRAWRKMAGKVDLRLLCLFMVADRVDCPGGWRSNRPLVWFLQQVRDRKLLQQELHLDEGPLVSQPGGASVEVSSGAALVRGDVPNVEVLVVKVRSAGYELPKGHLEWDEGPAQAASRELRKETGLVTEVMVGEPLGTLEYSFEKDGVTVQKRVRYFLCTPRTGEPPNFGPKPSRTKELRWITAAEVADLPLVNEDLRPILHRAFSPTASNECAGQADGPDR